MHRLATCLTCVLLAACTVVEPTPPSAYRVDMPPPCTGDPSQDTAPCTETSDGEAPDYSYGPAYGGSSSPYAPVFIATPLVPVAPPAPPAPPHKPPSKPGTPPVKPRPFNPHQPMKPCPKGPRGCP